MAGTDSASTGSTAIGECNAVVALCQFSMLDGSNVAILSGINVDTALQLCGNNVNILSLGIGGLTGRKTTQYPYQVIA